MKRIHNEKELSPTIGYTNNKYQFTNHRNTQIYKANIKYLKQNIKYIKQYKGRN